MKIKLKNRILSALLAFAMVASLLPAGILPGALAAADNGALGTKIGENLTVTIGTDGYYEIHLSGINGTGGYNVGYAIIPNFAVRSDLVPQDRIGNSPGINLLNSSYDNLMATADNYILKDSGTPYVPYATHQGSYTLTENVSMFGAAS